MFRGNQYPCRDEDKLNQQLKQLDSTTYSARNNTASDRDYYLKDNFRQLFIDDNGDNVSRQSISLPRRG
jgi:hypothetical protein